MYKTLWLGFFLKFYSPTSHSFHRVDSVPVIQLWMSSCCEWRVLTCRPSLAGSTWEDSCSPAISSRPRPWRLEAELLLCTCVCVSLCGWVCTLVFAILIISCSFCVMTWKSYGVVSSFLAHAPSWSSMSPWFECRVSCRALSAKWCVVMEVALYVCDYVQNWKVI